MTDLGADEGAIELTASLWDISTREHSFLWRLLHFVRKFRLSSTDICFISESRSRRNMRSELLAFQLVHHLILITFMRSVIIFSLRCFWCNTISSVWSYLRLFSHSNEPQCVIVFWQRRYLPSTLSYFSPLPLRYWLFWRVAAYEDRFGQMRLDFSGCMSVCLVCRRWKWYLNL